MSQTDQAELEQAVEHHRANRLREAEAIYRRLIARDPGNPAPLHMLGLLALQTGHPDPAAELIGRAVALRPDLAALHRDLGNALHDADRVEDALASFREAARLRPDDAKAYGNIGNALHRLGRLDEAIDAYRSSLRLEPDLPETHNNLGGVMLRMGKLDEAIACYRRAIELRPDYADAHANLGTALAFADDVDPALQACETAVALAPRSPNALHALGNVRSEQGLMAQAIAAYQKAVDLAPDNAAAHENLVYSMHYDPACDGAAILQAHVQWARVHTDRFAAGIPPHQNTRDPDRVLRIGYVSADFREHAVGRFLLPLFEGHDRERSTMHIVCYFIGAIDDAMTDRLRSHADEWHAVGAFSSERLARLIRGHQIDILVDLSLHTAGGRLFTFSRKPAPIQVTYLGYPGTSGMRVMDYRITDPFLDPPEEVRPFYVERPLYILSYWCYRPPEHAPPVAPLPAERAKHITFGCMNHIKKVSAPALETFARIVASVPDSQLILHLKPTRRRDDVTRFFAARGVDPNRIIFIGRQDLIPYLQTYDRIDIALDPFPYNGGTTSCDALWMGVPLVTLAGDIAVHRAGVSILSNIGLPQLIATSTEQYIKIAKDLAADLPRLAELRRTMRERMLASPLMNEMQFVRSVEDAFRRIWRDWCR